MVETRWRRWRPAACTTRSAAASTATRSTPAGSCRTSRRCSTTTRCSRASTSWRIARSARPEDARIARETLDYLLREMTPDGGGRRLLRGAGRRLRRRRGHLLRLESEVARGGRRAPRPRPDRGRALRRHAGGQLRGAARPCSRSCKSVPELAAEFGRTEEEIERILAEARAADVRRARAKRVAPATDDKLLTDWSALAISAFALAGRVLDEPRYEAAARDGGGPDSRQLRARRTAAPPREGRPGRHPGLRDGLRLFHRGPARSLRGDVRAALLRRGAASSGGLRPGVRGPARRLLPLGGGARRPDRAAQGVLRRRDALVQLRRRRRTSCASRRSPATRRYARRAEAHLRALRRGRGARRAGLPAAALRARLSRAGARARSCSPESRARPDFEALRAAVFASPDLEPRARARVGGGARGARRADARAASRGTGAAAAYVCERFACKAPVADPASLSRLLERR